MWVMRRQSPANPPAARFAIDTDRGLLELARQESSPNCDDRPPGVDHFTGTELVIGHVEKYWCPSFVSSDITGGAPFKFKGVK